MNRNRALTIWIVAGEESGDQLGAKLMRALSDAGFTISHSEAGMYLWATSGNNCREDVAWLADLGILVAPGDFYGEVGAEYIRVGLNGTDERVEAACERLAAAGQR